MRIEALPEAEAPSPIPLETPALFDTGVWTWVRDRRFPKLAAWFNAQAQAGMVLVCDLVRLELVRLAANEVRAAEIADRLAHFRSVGMTAELWARSREIQLALSPGGQHRRVPPADLLIACAAERAEVPLVHYDGDYPLIAAVSDLEQRWFVPPGSLSPHSS